MATVEALRDIIIVSINDDSYTDEQIDRFINQAIRKTSAMVLLPVLERSDAVTTVIATPYVDVPDDFGHNLFAAATTAGSVDVMASMRLLLDEYPLFGVTDETGDIQHCCLSGTQIAIHPVPIAATQVRLFYHTWPETLADTDDVNQYITDEEIQEDIIVNYALWKLHKGIEDGLEGAMNNTAYHEAQFKNAVRALGATIRQGQSRPTPQRKTWNI